MFLCKRFLHEHLIPFLWSHFSLGHVLITDIYIHVHYAELCIDVRGVCTQGFNKEMEEITKLQKSFAIPDIELRTKLKKDNKDFVLPHYRTFLKKYATVHFTKNPEKYIKYTERDVSGFIDQFFDASS